MGLLTNLVIYNFVVFAIFSGLNYAQREDFEYLTTGDPKNLTSTIYYSFSVHAALGISDINPKTNLARYTAIAHLSIALVGSAYIAYGTRTTSKLF
jgi:hypothetical protein